MSVSIVSALREGVWISLTAQSFLFVTLSVT